jgi:hypothetical protein
MMVMSFLVMIGTLSLSQAAGATLTLTQEQCRALVQEGPPADGGAYQPNIDTAGDPVVPADLPPDPVQQLWIPPRVGIQLGSDARRSFGFPLTGKDLPFLNQFDYGTAVFDMKAGVFYINGQVLDLQTRHRLYHYCKKHLDLQQEGPAVP